MGDPWQDEGFGGGDVGGDDWDEGQESIETDLEEELGDGVELGNESWEDDEDEE